MREADKADRDAQLAEIAADFAALHLKYPLEVYSELENEPSDVLAYARKLIRFGGRFNVPEREYVALIWKPVPRAYVNLDGTLKRHPMEIAVGLPPEEL